VPGLDRTLNEDSHLEDIDGDRILQEVKLPYQIIHLLMVLLLAAIPTLFLNLPVGVLAGLYSERRRKKALAKSKVKVRGFDVMLTEKVVFCIVAIPTLWFIYFVLLYFFTDFDAPTIALCIMSLPLFAYVGIIVSEAGMMDFKDVRPYLLRLLPSTRRRLKALPAVRIQLQTDIRAFIKLLGPSIGDIYYGKELDWKEIQAKSRMRSSQINLANASSSNELDKIKTDPDEKENETYKKDK
jgi:glycerol-3-phosphate O-acyltransferase/dihydroxyacetone phosphate acyltransferase